MTTSTRSRTDTAEPDRRTPLAPQVDAPQERPGLGLRILIGLIRVYQLARTGRVSPCRFTPTCSQYAVDALCLHGTRRGLRLIAGRLTRCRPGGPFGADPVPE